MYYACTHAHVSVSSKWLEVGSSEVSPVLVVAEALDWGRHGRIRLRIGQRSRSSAVKDHASGLYGIVELSETGMQQWMVGSWGNPESALPDRDHPSRLTCTS